MKISEAISAMADLAERPCLSVYLPEDRPGSLRELLETAIFILLVFLIVRGVIQNRHINQNGTTQATNSIHKKYASDIVSSQLLKEAVSQLLKAKALLLWSCPANQSATTPTNSNCISIPNHT